MQSKKSFFNATLFKKNLSRFWPLWGGVSLVGALVPLYLVLAILTDRGMKPDSAEFAETLYQAVTMFAPAFIMGYAIVCAALVWSYLYSPRAVGLMHTLPVDRTCLFVTNTLSGLAMVLIPFAVVGGLMILISLLWGFFHLMAVVYTIAAVLCMAVLFFSIATLCAMLTGHLAVLPVLYVLANFLASALEALLTYFSSQFLLGVNTETTTHLMFLSPVLKIYERFNAVYVDLSENGPIYTASSAYRTKGYSETPILYGRVPTVGNRAIGLTGMGTVALYGLVGVVLLALAWLLYRKRQSERAGDVVAYRPLRPVFRYGVALLSALAPGELLYELLWGSTFESGATVDAVPMALCMALAGVIGYYIASMLLEKSLRVFRGSWKGVVLVCAASAVMCGVARVDIMGLEDKIPELEDIASVQIYGAINDLYYSTDTEDGRWVAEQVLDIHRAILADKPYARSAVRKTWERGMSGLYIQYDLKDGSYLGRSYRLLFTEDRIADPNTYDGKVYALSRSETARLDRVRIPENASLIGIDVLYNGDEVETGIGVETYDIEVYDTMVHTVNDKRDYERMYDALLQDAREDNLPYEDFVQWYFTEDKLEVQNFGIRMQINYVEKGEDYVSAKSVYVYDGMEHTIAELIRQGYFSENDFDLWRAGYKENNK